MANYAEYTDLEISEALTQIVKQLKERDLLSEAYGRTARSLAYYTRNVALARFADNMAPKKD